MTCLLFCTLAFVLSTAFGAPIENQLIESPEDSECFFPFHYKNETYETCVNIVSSSEHGQCATGSPDLIVGRTYKNCTANDVFLSNLVVEDFDVPCHFPFMFQNEMYNECTSLLQDTKYGQCATTSNFDTDGRYRNCTNVIGCHFPFVWQNQTHNDCISYSFTDDWCSRTDNYDRDGLKIPCFKNGYMSRLIEEDDTHDCHFPFAYHNRMVHRCIRHNTGRFICATTSSFNRDRKYRYCNQAEIDASLVIPTELNINCKFPFSVDFKDGSNRSTVFHGCTTAKNYLGDRPYCVVEGPSGGQYAARCLDSPFPNNSDLIVTHIYTYTDKECIFPFEYDGFWFHGCTSYKHPDGRSWCATTMRSSGSKTEYDDFDLCVVEENTVITTFGGNAGGAPCHFPFVEDVNNDGAEWHDKCIHKKHGWGWWCSTTSNHTKDDKWGWCNVKNTDTKLLALIGDDGLGKTILKSNCHFPFIYGGEKHYACIGTFDTMKWWCGTTDDYDTDESYAWCDKHDMWATIQPERAHDLNTPCTFPFVYHGKLHFDLIRVPGKTFKIYCSTSRNYDRDRQYIWYKYDYSFTTTRRWDLWW